MDVSGHPYYYPWRAAAASREGEKGFIHFTLSASLYCTLRSLPVVVFLSGDCG